MDRLQPAIGTGRQPAISVLDRRLAQSRDLMRFSFRFLTLAFAIVSCGEGHAAAADSSRADSVALADSMNRAQPGYIVDSILPIEEHLRRFRAGLPDTLRALVGGARSLDELVRAFVRSLEASDTTALGRLTISRAEFAWLVYPDSPLSAPPYRLAPDLAWMRHVAASGTGLRRLLERLGGSPLGFDSLRCLEGPITEGANQIWRDCAIRFEKPGSEAQTLRLFSSIIERRGQFKILSYANGF
jgi:hypothetical protein